jgi:hypothetical protein
MPCGYLLSLHSLSPFPRVFFRRQNHDGFVTILARFFGILQAKRIIFLRYSGFCDYLVCFILPIEPAVASAEADAAVWGG